MSNQSVKWWNRPSVLKFLSQKPKQKPDVYGHSVTRSKSRNKIKLAYLHVTFNAGSKNHSLVFVEGLV